MNVDYYQTVQLDVKEGDKITLGDLRRMVHLATSKGFADNSELEHRWGMFYLKAK